VEMVRVVRDQIEVRVRDLLDELVGDGNAPTGVSA